MMNSKITMTAALLINAFAAAAAQASSLTFQPNNGAIFADGNPNGNAQMLATAIKPKNTGKSTSTTPAFDVSNQGSLAAQAIFTQQQAQLNNEVFNCGTGTCKPSSPVGGIPLGGGYTLSYIHNPNGTVTTTLVDPQGHSTTLTTSYSGSLPTS